MSVTDRRVQLYLPEEQYRGVMRLADERRTSFAQVVREAIEEFFRKNHARWGNDPITKHIGLFKTKDRDLSIRHDEYLYGKE